MPGISAFARPSGLLGDWSGGRREEISRGVPGLEERISLPFHGQTNSRLETWCSPTGSCSVDSLPGRDWWRESSIPGRIWRSEYLRPFVGLLQCCPPRMRMDGSRRGCSRLNFPAKRSASTFNWAIKGSRLYVVLSSWCPFTYIRSTPGRSRSALWTSTKRSHSGSRTSNLASCFGKLVVFLGEQPIQHNLTIGPDQPFPGGHPCLQRGPVVAKSEER